MSSIGRPSLNIDLNTSSISAIVEVEQRLDDIENNLGVASIPEQKDADDNIIVAFEPATHLNLDVENLQANLGNASTDGQVWGSGRIV